MVKLAAFLIILVILFGVEATRDFIFGSFGFIFWIVTILVGIGILGSIFGSDNSEDENAEQNQEEQKEVEPVKANTVETSEQEVPETKESKGLPVFVIVYISLIVLVFVLIGVLIVSHLITQQ